MKKNADSLAKMAICWVVDFKEDPPKIEQGGEGLMIEATKYEKIRQESFEEGLKQGIKKGLQQGIQQGIAQGIKQGLEEGKKQGLFKAIILGLKLKFGVEGLRLYTEIREIQNLALLEAISEAIETAQTPQELQKLYQ